jgi:hypothetical protein
MKNIERFLAHCSDDEKKKLIDMLHESMESKGEEKEEHKEEDYEEEEEEKKPAERSKFNKGMNKKPEYMR